MNNQTNIASQKVFNLFQRYRDRPFVFVESGGNFGDFLIYRGAEKLAKLAGLHYRTIFHQDLMKERFSKDTVVYMHGGGGFNDYWKMEPIKEFQHLLTHHAGVTIVGPQAFYFRKAENLDALKASLHQGSVAEKVYFFTRENHSLNLLKEIVPSWIDLQSDHDTAFNLSADDFSEVPQPKNYKLYAIRQDIEKATIKNTNPFRLWFDPIADCKNFDEWVSVHQHAQIIITNRLHSAVLGSILGKDVTLLPNSYFKNRAVWEYSLQSKGVKWQDQISSTSLHLWSKFADSYKVRQFVKKFYLK